MENTIGATIGIVKHTFSIKNDAGDKVQLTIEVDFNTASDTDIKAWLVSNRVIAGQRPLRTLSKEELENLNHTTFIAQDIGRKVKSREEQIQTLVSAGLSEKLARFKLDSPDKFQAAMNKYEAALESEVHDE